jgi:ATP-dependent helicase/nuclease subunit B
LVLKTPSGGELRLRGRIDRVDRVQNQADFAVIDYKYRGSTLALDWVYHGLSLQLLTYVLVMQKNGSELAKQKFRPVAALYVKLLRQLKRVKHPDDATAPDDPTFNLTEKPRGIIDLSRSQLLDRDLAGKASDVVNLYIKTDGTLGKKNISDGCESAEFAAMLRLAERKLAEMGAGILSGQIDVSPYRIGQATPCEYCEYRAVCRFDASINRYHQLEKLSREQVLERAVAEEKA